MGSKNKLKRFKENESFSNVIQPSREDLISNNFELKGLWASKFFKNNQPVVLELGCGKGEYTIGLAQQFPNINFIGIDVKGARFWRGAKTAIENGLSNVAFLRIQIELLTYAFAKHEVEAIWITFPDPQIKYKRTKHRLTNLNFLEKYQEILVSEGTIHLKTDSEFLHGYTLGLLHAKGFEVCYANHNVYKLEGSPKEVTNIQTFYETQYLKSNKAITYLAFKLK